MGTLKKRGINYMGMANRLMVQETGYPVLPATQLDTLPRFLYLRNTNIVTVTQRENKNIFIWILSIKFMTDLLKHSNLLGCRKKS